MATLRSSLMVQDKMSAALGSITNSLNILIGSFEDMQAASAQPIDTAALRAARDEIQSASADISRMEEDFENAAQGARRFQRETRGAQNETDNLLSKAKQVAIAVASWKTLEFGAGLSDELVQIKARLDLINDGQQSTEQLNNMIFQSAQRSRGAYLDTAAAVANLSMQAKEAFKDNSEAIYFSELLNKIFTVSGTSQQGAESVMYNLTQAMASGVLRGQDLNAVMSNAPMILQQVADYMGVPIGKIREMAAEGQLSAQLIKEAMFAASGETEAMFAQMPMTFAQTKQSIQNQLISMFEPILMRINELLNDPAVQTAINGLITGIGYIASAIGWVIEIAVQLANVIAENWSWIEPIVMGIAIAIGLWTVATLAQKTATWLATTAQMALNSAILTSPLTWIIVVVAAVIVAIYKWVQAVGGIRIAWLIAVNAILTAWDWVKIGFFTGVYWVQNLFGKMSYGFSVVAVAIANIMGDMSVSVLKILQGMVNGAIRIINGFIEKVNVVVGVFTTPIGLIAKTTFADVAAEANKIAKQAREESLAAKLTNLEGDIASRQRAIDIMKADARSSTRIRLAEIDAAKADLNKPMEEVEQAEEFKPPIDPASYVFDPSILGGNEEKGKKLKSLDNNVGAIKDSLDISNEELKYLREIAERDVINRFTFADMNFDFTNIQSEPDIDGVVEQFGDWLKGQLVGAAEGVHV